ncbi:TonB C-terminal domain-containing protein [Edaphobacter bradus]|uniref:TonB C-terminal domain-containing protein n=1 Tax=Edaphobacter bradus TaxID=2259016 RepID=UPI0021E07021|nr:TonB C-terminal domain-containing protein [Edaphobacter bradus]
MPTLETPPNPAPPSPPVKVRSSRYGDLEEHELIHLLDTLDDERSRARFREAVYISIIIWLAIAWFVLYGPQVIFHQPRLINPADVLRERDKQQLTYLDMPNDVSKALPKKPSNVISDKDRVQQTAKPTLDKKTLEQLQAMRRAGEPSPAPSAPAPQPAQQQSQQQAEQPSAPQPLPQHPPQQQPIVDAPRPAPTRPNFGSQTQSAGDAIRQAAEQAARSRGQGGDFGANAPVAHGGLNTGVEVLSDTMGVDFAPYLRRILGDIRRTWVPLIPEEARPPLNKQGETLIRFTILPDGRIGEMHLEASTHDQAIDRAAWGGITGVGQFPPLPSNFKGPNLELRIAFLVNKNPE